MFRNQSAKAHHFSMTPRPEVPRSAFNIQKSHKTTFDSGWLVPIYVDEVLPGDSFSVSMTAFCRLSTPLFPIMDNLHMDTFFFFVPNRLVWDNWQKFMGERLSPNDSISYTIPQVVSPAGGWNVGSLADHFGLPSVGQVGPAATISTSVLPLRAYNLIWNEWFRDENLQVPAPLAVNDGPDAESAYMLRKRGKRHDYFTSCLPWPQKGDSVALPLGGTAPIVGEPTGSNVPYFTDADGTPNAALTTISGLDLQLSTNLQAGVLHWGNQTGLVADLSAATAATINSMRQAFQVQKLLERDARGGTRYTEIIRSHFGVVSPDARLQRPEYLGGGSSPIIVNPVAQTSATGAPTDGTPLGTLGATATALANRHGFNHSFTEHGYVIGLINVRADLTYQQGIRKLWSRKTRYDFYFPAFAMLGEQAVLSKEIFADGSTDDEQVFGYQERWSEYRYQPSTITSLFRSTATGTLDAWHLAQKFTNRPLLVDAFITEAPPLPRTLAVGAEALGQELICDAFFNIRAVRPLPMYSVPGLIDHF